MATLTERRQRVTLTAEEAGEIKAGTRREIRRRVTPQPGSPGPSHVYGHPTEGWWTFGNNSGEVYYPPRLPKQSTWGIRFSAETVAIEKNDDGEWEWVVTFTANEPAPAK